MADLTKADEAAAERHKEALAAITSGVALAKAQELEVRRRCPGRLLGVRRRGMPSPLSSPLQHLKAGKAAAAEHLAYSSNLAKDQAALDADIRTVRGAVQRRELEYAATRIRLEEQREAVRAELARINALAASTAQAHNETLEKLAVARRAAEVELVKGQAAADKAAAAAHAALAKAVSAASEEQAADEAKLADIRRAAETETEQLAKNVSTLLRQKARLAPQLTVLHAEQARLVAETAELQKRLSDRRCVGGQGRRPRLRCQPSLLPRAAR